MDQWGEGNEEPEPPAPAGPSVLENPTLKAYVALGTAVAALLWATFPAWGEGWMPVRGDALTYFWPLRETLGAALRQGELPLYETTNNGGTPLWLNPQAQSLYPPARLYRYAPVPHAMGILDTAHLLLLFSGVVALLRRLSFGVPASSLAALTVALGGTFLSLSPMQDKAHSAAWMPWMIWAALSLNRPRLLPRLLLAGATAMAVLAGGLDIVVMAVLASLLAAACCQNEDPELSPIPTAPELDKNDGSADDDLFGMEPDGGEEDFQPLLTDGPTTQDPETDEPQLTAAVSLNFAALPERASESARYCLRAGFWIALGLGISAPQWLPFRALIEQSSWGAPLPPAELSARSLRLGDILGLLAPNLAWNAAESVYRPPGFKEAVAVYLPGLYAGSCAVLLWFTGVAALVRSHFTQQQSRWLLPGPMLVLSGGALLCVLMAAGPAIPPIAWVELNVPVLSSIRFPAKWLIPGAILGSIPIAAGAHVLSSPALPWPLLRKLTVGLVTLTLAAALVGITSSGDLSRAASLSATALATCWLICALWRVQALGNQRGIGTIAVACAVAILGLDLATHNLPLMPLDDPAKVVTPPVAASRVLRNAEKQRRASATLLPTRARLHQVSYSQHDADPISTPEAPLHQILREAMMGGVPAVWGIEVMNSWLVMPPAQLARWYSAILEMPLARQIEGLRLAGVTHLLVHFRDDALELMPLVGRGLEEIYVPEGDWTQVALFAVSDPLPACRWTPIGQPSAEGLPIVPDQDEGGRWTGRVSAGAGLVVCLRPWDPAWEVRIDGNRVPTQIANGFQLAAPVPTGAREISMEYIPAGLNASFRLRSLSLTLLFLGLGLGLLRGWGVKPATEPEADAQDDSEEAAADR